MTETEASLTTMRIQERRLRHETPFPLHLSNDLPIGTFGMYWCVHSSWVFAHPPEVLLFFGQVSQSMTGTAFVVLSQGPEWWYESWSVQQWLQTLFNQPLEVHTFVLGAIIGVILATLAFSWRPEMALTLTIAVVLFTFGAFEPVYICSREYTACRHVQIKPWYFLSGFLFAHLGLVGGIRSVTGKAPRVSTNDRAASLFAWGVLLLLVGIALYSFVSPELIHPITGLPTIGGVFGAAIGLVAYEWALVAGGARAGLLVTIRRVLGHNLHGSVFVLGYGAAFGFGYPRFFWELGQIVGREGFLFGQIFWATTGWLSVVTYVIGIFSFTVGVFWAQSRMSNRSRVGPHRVPPSVLAHVCYGICLFGATGLAGSVWFRLIPSAPV